LQGGFFVSGGDYAGKVSAVKNSYEIDPQDNDTPQITKSRLTGGFFNHQFSNKDIFYDWEISHENYGSR